MRIDDPRDQPLSDGAMAIIGSLLESAPQGQPPSVVESLVVRVACGIASGEEELVLVSEAAKSAVLRRQYAQIRGRAIALARHPLGSVLVHSEEDRQIIEALQLRLSSWLIAAGEPRGKVESRQWQDFLDRASSEVNALRQVVQAVGESLRRSRERSIFATAREGTDSEATVPLGEGITAGVTVEPLEEGGLRIAISIQDAEGDVSNEANGRILVLSLTDPAGGAAPIHSGPVQDASWTVVMEQFAQATGIDPTTITAGDFQISLDSESRIASPKRYLYVEVPPELRRQGVSLFPAELAGPPIVRDGTMSLALRLPEDIPKLYFDAALEISIGFGSGSQVIGSRKLDSWTTGFCNVKIPMLNVPAGQIACGSIIHLRLSSTN